jgi:site-specific DNA-cytosine methylase
VKTHKPTSNTDAEHWTQRDHAPTLTYWPRDREDGGTNVAIVHPADMTVRRLTPRECERAMGFPDDWTCIPWDGKPAAACPDAPRYKALGNSIAVNCLRWVGQRIAAVEDAWGA